MTMVGDYHSATTLYHPRVYPTSYLVGECMCLLLELVDGGGERGIGWRHAELALHEQLLFELCIFRPQPLYRRAVRWY